MYKKAVPFMLALTALTTHAELWQSFDKIDDVTEIKEGVKTKNNIEIVQYGSSKKNKILRVNAPKAFIKIPIDVTKKVKLGFNWRSNTTPDGGWGEILRLADFNHSKQFLALNLEAGFIKASTFINKKIKMRKLVKIEPSIWYKINIESNDKEWTVTIKRRGEFNTPKNETELFDSEEERKKLRTNKNVQPKVVMFAQWANGKSFDYDNLYIK